MLSPAGRWSNRGDLRPTTPRHTITPMSVRIPHGSRRTWSIAALACLSLCCHDQLYRARAADKTTLPEFLVRSWDNQDGLPAAAVRAIARTPDGYFWVGTEKGL